MTVDGYVCLVPSNPLYSKSFGKRVFLEVLSPAKRFKKPHFQVRIYPGSWRYASEQSMLPRHIRLEDLGLKARVSNHNC